MSDQTPIMGSIVLGPIYAPLPRYGMPVNEYDALRARAEKAEARVKQLEAALDHLCGVVEDGLNGFGDCLTCNPEYVTSDGPKHEPGCSLAAALKSARLVSDEQAPEKP